MIKKIKESQNNIFVNKLINDFDFTLNIKDIIDWQTISKNTNLSMAFIKYFKNEIIMCNNIKNKIKLSHCNIIFKKNNIFPNDINLIISKYII